MKAALTTGDVAKPSLTPAWMICAALAGAIGSSAVVTAPVLAQTGTAQTSATETGATPPGVSIDQTVTDDSAKGWTPSEDLKQQAIKAADDYFAMLDAEQYDGAYAMMAEADRRSVTPEQFAVQRLKFRDKAGALQRRDILKISWTKDPSAAPFPGIYAAVDVAASYANIDRYCGYIVLYQKPAGGRFEIMREESNFIDNATAQTIERQHSRAVLDAMWSKLAANCPNYPPAGAPASKP